MTECPTATWGRANGIRGNHGPKSAFADSLPRHPGVASAAVAWDGRCGVGRPRATVRALRMSGAG